MRSLLLSFLVALPLFAQLPSGTTRVHFRDYMWAYHLVATPNDALWAVDYLNAEISRVGLEGTTLNFDMPGNWHSRAATAGPDGALWIAG